MSIETVEITSPGSFSIVEIRQGPAGTGGGGSVAWDDITGTASDVPFLPVAAPAHSEGLVFYDSTDKSLTYYNDEADVSMNIGREMWVRVRNNSGSPILNGKVVYINDAVGQLPTIRLARADSAVTSRVIGIATHDIGNNEFGYVTTTGEVKGLATNAYDDGDLLFLSAVTAGELTLTAPLAPNRVIQVATVLHAHPTQGKLYCHPETDSIPSTGIVDSTATGRALITAANASAARTTLELAAAAAASTPNTLVLRDNTGGTSFAGTVVMGVADISDLQFQDYQAAAGATFTYGTGAASAHRFALNGGAATGEALFTAVSASAARTTLGVGSLATFTATDNQPPATAFATLDTRNSIAVLDFDAATDESAIFVGIIPEATLLGSGLKIRLQWMATSATSGNVVWDVSLERMTTDLDSDSFDTIASGTAAANGTSGILTVTEITLTTIDSVAAGDGYRLKVTRDANNASDTMTGDAELVVVEIRSAT